MPYLLDTCAVLFVAGNTADLSPATLKLIDAALPGEVFVSAISVAALACLQERGKITLKQHWRAW
jgi:PIN domain nuclease of toxin-antitoxin system